MPIEFDCTCGCGSNEMINSFVKMLDMARDRARTPFRINSGYRCNKKQMQLYQNGISTKKKSSHQLGIAADIAIPGDDKRSKILWGLIQVGFTRFGIGKNWIHVDVDHNKNMNRIWVYK